MPSPSRIFPPEAPPPLQAPVNSDIFVILTVLLCALSCVVGLFLVARIRRVFGRRAPQVPANKGLEKKVIRSLPKASFDGAVDGKLQECPICLTEFADGDQIRLLPQCGHLFHVTCVDTWLGSHSSCPSCRRVLVVPRCHNCGEVHHPEGEAKGRVGLTAHVVEP